MSAIPLVAWEQAAIIIIVLGFLLLLVDKLVKLSRELKTGIDETNRVTQSFLIERDRQWQSYLTELRKNDFAEQLARETDFSKRNTRVVEATDALAKTIALLVEEQRMHNAETRDAIHDMRQRTEPIVRGSDRRVNQQSPGKVE